MIVMTLTFEITDVVNDCSERARTGTAPPWSLADEKNGNPARLGEQQKLGRHFTDL